LIINNNEAEDYLISGRFDDQSVAIARDFYLNNAYTLWVAGDVYAQGSFISSDQRLKNDIQPLKGMLNKLQLVDGVSYQYKPEVLDSVQQSRLATHPEEAVRYGLVAQQVQEVFPELVREDEGKLAVNYDGMIPVLIEALKELSNERDSVQTLMQQNIRLEQELITIRQELAMIKEALNVKSDPREESASFENKLEQNFPNPFDESTTIRYQVSEAAGWVHLIITDMQGREVLRLEQLAAGKSEVTIPAGSLPMGTYLYTLQADGRVIDTKRMILTQ
jgi:hypothetical protein